MKKLIFLLLFPIFSFAQKEYKIFSIPKANKLLNLSIQKVVEDYTLLDANTKKVWSEEPNRFSFKINLDHKDVKITLKKVHYDTKIILSNGNRFYSNNIFYRGSVNGDSKSFAAFMVNGEAIEGMVCNKEGNHVIGKMGVHHIAYNDRDLIGKEPFVCGTKIDVEKINKLLPKGIKLLSATITNKCVNWYWEIDYNVYVYFGDEQLVSDWAEAVFNQVAAIYANEGITINLKTLFIWTSPSPYTGPTTDNYYSQFINHRQTVPSATDGDLAHLIGFAGRGGEAAVGGLCSIFKQLKKAYSGVWASYNSVPIYSQTVDIIAHEEGHLLGSQHTHDCVWNGNNTAIDGCGQVVSGGRYRTGICPIAPLPTNGGTLMSYCDLGSWGVNFSLGLGQQPGDLIRNFINSSPCVAACGTNPPPCTIPNQPGPISGNINVLQGSSQTYSTLTTTGVTYKWALPSGWVGSSVSSSISTKAGSSGTVSVQAINSCGSSAWRNLSVNTYTIAPVDSCTTRKITATIQVRASDYKAVGSNSTNYKYRWAVNGVFKTTSQLLLKSQVKSGDKIDLEISSLTVTNSNCFGKASLIVP